MKVFNGSVFLLFLNAKSGIKLKIWVKCKIRVHNIDLLCLHRLPFGQLSMELAG